MSFDDPFDLSPSDAAAIIGVHEDTLKRWAANGKIPALRTPGGWWRFRRSDVDQFMAGGGDRPDPVPVEPSDVEPAS